MTVCTDSVCCIGNPILLLITLTLQDGQTALYVASWNGHDEVVKILLKAKADLNLQRNVSNCTYQNGV